MSANNSEHPYPNRHKMLGILLLFYILSIVDRQLVAVLSPTLKADLHLSDTELGWLKGFSFIFIYSCIGIPIAWLAERKSRVNIITFALVLWSGFTVLLGLAANYVQLAMARFGFGIGIAGLSPPAHSLISIYYLPTERARAFAIFSFGIPLGNMLAFILGGWLNNSLGWRSTFIVFGLVGIVLGLLGLVLKEPQHDKAIKDKETFNQESLIASIKLLLRIPSYRRLCLGACLGAFGVSGTASWIIDLVIRSDLLNYADISLYTGLTYGILGSMGMFLGGYFCDRFSRANTSYQLLIPGIALFLSAPCLAIALTTDSGAVTLLSIAASIFFMFFFQGPVFSAVQSISPPHTRAIAAALIIFCINMGGAGMGPFLVGVFSDYFASTHEELDALRQAMFLLVIALAAGGVTLIYSAKRLRADLYSQLKTASPRHH